MRLRNALATAAAATMLVTLVSAPAEAASPMRFSRVQYDSPGTDTGSNMSLNAEWIRVTNHGAKTRTLTGWKIRDKAGHTYRFPKGFKLRPGKSVRIHSGKGRNSGADLYWRQAWYVWNNTGDRAVLKNKSNHFVDACKWGDGSGAKNC